MLALILLLAAPSAAAPADPAAVKADLALILREARLPEDAVTFARRAAPESRIAVTCVETGVRLDVAAPDEEWGPALYHGLHRLGFLFPHPRRQISPSLAKLRAACEARWSWRPRLRRRGFHLHTQHPNEWVAGFFEGREAIAEDTVRWIARNRQNVLQLKALRTADPARAAPALRLARSLGVATGLEVSLCSVQQKSYRLLPGLWPLAGVASRRLGAWRVRRSIDALAEALPLDYLSIELGSSEFTPTPAGVTLSWLEAARAAAADRGLQVFTKVHVSSGQRAKGGNYNFLTSDADPRVGVQVHTVMPFGLEGPAPVYGRSDFSDLKAFLLEQRPRRTAWYYPETSYFIGVDIDVPLLLTAYLEKRAEDMSLLVRSGVEGQVDFSSGQELGYWLFDWNVALLADGGAKDGALEGLRLLGEDLGAWRKELAWQRDRIVAAGLLPALGSSNLMDEIPFLRPEHRVLNRRILRELAKDEAARAAETAALERAAASMPSADFVRDPELRSVLRLTHARVRHALFVRRALAFPRGSAERAGELAKARAIREESLPVAKALAGFGRYPEARLFERRRDATSYRYGYGYPAATLFFWERDEAVVERGTLNPLFRSLYEPLAILL